MHNQNNNTDKTAQELISLLRLRLKEKNIDYKPFEKRLLKGLIKYRHSDGTHNHTHTIYNAMYEALEELQDIINQFIINESLNKSNKKTKKMFDKFCELYRPLFSESMLFQNEINKEINNGNT